MDVGADVLGLDLSLPRRRTRNMIETSSSVARKAAPTPIPALAPVDRRVGSPSDVPPEVPVEREED